MCVCISISALQLKLTKVGLVQVASPLLSLIHTIVLCWEGHKCFARQTNICAGPPISKGRQQSLYFPAKTVMSEIISFGD